MDYMIMVKNFLIILVLLMISKGEAKNIQNQLGWTLQQPAFGRLNQMLYMEMQEDMNNIILKNIIQILELGVKRFLLQIEEIKIILIEKREQTKEQNGLRQLINVLKEEMH